MYLKTVYDHRFFSFLAQLGVVTNSQKKLFKAISKIFRIKLVQILFVIIERIIAFIITLPVPVYSDIIYVFIKSCNGYFGYYIRSIYYSSKALKWGGNIIIDEDVIFENIKNYQIDEFVMIDKKVIVAPESLKIGKGVHIGMGTIIAKGGEVIFEDFSAVSFGSIIIASSDSPAGGHRLGPMVPESQRNVTKGKVILKKDSWVTTNVVVMPGTTIGTGSIVSSNSVVNKNIKDWKIRLIEQKKSYMDREKVKFPDPEY